MLTKIKRADCVAQFPIFPLRNYDHAADEEIFLYPKVYKSYILTYPSKSFRGHIRTIAEELTCMITAFGSAHLITLGDSEIPWLYKPHDYKPAHEAQQYLTDQKIGKRFNGALKVNTEELITFTKHLGWLIRCNAILPYVHFTDQQQSILGNICQYGNLHLDTMNEKSDAALKSFILSSRLIFGDVNSCDNFYSRKTPIPGRKLIL